MSTEKSDFHVTDEQRFHTLLDDLRAEVARLADEMEKSNELKRQEREAER